MSAESGVPESGASEFKPITSQEDFNRAIADRVNRERSKFADYDDLKAKADKFSEWEQSQKSEQERLREQLEGLSKKAAEQDRENARLKAITAEGIPAEYQDLVHGDTPEQFAASAKKAKELISKVAAAESKPGVSYRVNLDGDGSENLALNGSGIEDALKKKLGIA